MQPAPAVQSRFTLIGGLLIVAAVLAAYAGCYSGVFVLDDIPSIPNNPTIRHLSDWVRVLTPLRGVGLTVEGRPVLNASFALNYAAGGIAVFGYHLVNVGIHLLAALTLFGLLRRLTHRPGLAWSAALLWAVHPLTTAAVTYVVQRAESLMSLFYLATLYAFVRSVSGSQRARGWAAVSVTACWLGMGTKEVMVSAPVTVMLLDRLYFAGSFAAAWRERKSYYLSLGASWIMLGFLVWHTGSRGQTSGFGSGVGAAQYWATQPGVILHYLRLVVWPAPLVFDYGVHWLGDPLLAVTPALAIVALAAASLWGVIKNRPWGLLGALFFALLAPTSIVPGNRQTGAEQRMYLASAVAIIALVGLAVWIWNRRRPATGRLSLPALGLTAALAALLATQTYRRNQDYRSAVALYGADVAHVPTNAYAQSNYATALHYARRDADALPHFETAIRINPDIQETENNLANALLALGRTDEAVAHYRRSIATHPQYSEAYGNLATAYLEMDRVPEARSAVETALRLNPQSADAHDHLAVVLIRENRLPEALQEFAKATELDPMAAAHWNNYSNALRSAGQPAAAIEAIRHAVQLAPDTPKYFFNWGGIEMDRHRYPAAEALLRESVRLDPTVAGVHQNLGNTLLAEDRAADAVAEYETAARLAPDDAIVHYNFGNGLLRLNRPKDALREFQRAVKLNPQLKPARQMVERLGP